MQTSEGSDSMTSGVNYPDPMQPSPRESDEAVRDPKLDTNNVFDSNFETNMAKDPAVAVADPDATWRDPDVRGEHCQISAEPILTSSLKQKDACQLCFSAKVCSSISSASPASIAKLYEVYKESQVMCMLAYAVRYAILDVPPWYECLFLGFQVGPS